MSEKVDLSAGPGLHETDALAHLKLGRSFLAGPHLDDQIIQLKWYVRESDGALVGRVWWGPGAQGPPGHAHGGSMAAVLDEALGSSCWVAGHPVVAAELNTRFKKMLPLGHVYTAEGWVERVDGRKIYARGQIIDEHGTVYAEADGIFVEMKRDQYNAILEQIRKT